PNSGELCITGARRHWRPYLPPNKTFPRLCVFKFRHEATAASPGHGGRCHLKALSSDSDSPHGFYLLCLQNSPAATTEASDFGDGQGFAHLQVGGHADWHVPHGGCAMLCCCIWQLLSGLRALSFCHQDGSAQPAFCAGAVYSLCREIQESADLRGTFSPGGAVQPSLSWGAWALGQRVLSAQSIRVGDQA
ncbi:hypothetical protein GH733_013536, partial [Mirounga leonina]